MNVRPSRKASLDREMQWVFGRPVDHIYARGIQPVKGNPLRRRYF